eukprot:g4906.t1
MTDSQIEAKPSLPTDLSPSPKLEDDQPATPSNVVSNGAVDCENEPLFDSLSVGKGDEIEKTSSEIDEDVKDIEGMKKTRTSDKIVTKTMSVQQLSSDQEEPLCTIDHHEGMTSETSLEVVMKKEENLVFTDNRQLAANDIEYMKSAESEEEKKEENLGFTDNCQLAANDFENVKSAETEAAELIQSKVSEPKVVNTKLNRKASTTFITTREAPIPIDSEIVESVKGSLFQGQSISVNLIPELPSPKKRNTSSFLHHKPPGIHRKNIKERVLRKLKGNTEKRLNDTTLERFELEASQARMNSNWDFINEHESKDTAYNNLEKALGKLQSIINDTRWPKLVNEYDPLQERGKIKMKDFMKIAKRLVTINSTTLAGLILLVDPGGNGFFRYKNVYNYIKEAKMRINRDKILKANDSFSLATVENGSDAKLRVQSIEPVSLEPFNCKDPEAKFRVEPNQSNPSVSLVHFKGGASDPASIPPIRYLCSETNSFLVKERKREREAAKKLHLNLPLFQEVKEEIVEDVLNLRKDRSRTLLFLYKTSKQRMSERAKELLKRQKEILHEMEYVRDILPFNEDKRLFNK